MRHTVIGLFERRAQAEAARTTLVQAGFAEETIELQTWPPSSTDPVDDVGAGQGVWANIERFVGSLFDREALTPQTQRYTEALQRGAVLLCVTAASESHAALARDTLDRLGASEVDERSPDETMATTVSSREHSILDELGFRGAPPVSTTEPNPVREGRRVLPETDALAGDPLVPDPTIESTARGMDERSASGAAFSVPAAAPAQPSATRMEADLMAPSATVTSAPGAIGATPATVPDEFLEYEEDFRGHYDEQYANEGMPYGDYAPAYHHGATFARDEQYQGRSWDEVEAEARSRWATSSPDADSTWDRVRLAVRHGWEYVTRQRDNL